MVEIGSKEGRYIGFVAAVPFTINVFLRPHLEALKKDYDIFLACNGRQEELGDLIAGRIDFASVPIERKISPFRDLKALFALWRLFRGNRPDSVHSITPKAGLLAMLAARLAGVPVRLHTFTGQVWASKKGMARQLLKMADRFIVVNATRILADSPSQRQFLIDEKIVRAEDIDVLAEGSIAGVNLDRFRLDAKVRQRVRQELTIPEEALVFVFLGRLNRDKGVLDLARAFARVAEGKLELHLLVVGPDEENIEEEFFSILRPVAQQVHKVDYSSSPQDMLSASDIFCLPSYREGFGSVLIEAAALGLPAIASRIYGITDAVEEGFTGLLHTPGSVPELAEAMRLLAEDADRRHKMGADARERVKARFSEERVTRAFVDFYRSLFSRSTRDETTI